MEYVHIHLQTVSLGQVCFWPAAQVLNASDAQSSCVIDCGADVAPLDVAFPIKLCIQSMSTTEGWMSAVRAFSLRCGKLSLKSPRKRRLYICHMKMLPQEIWGGLYNTLVSYSQVSVFTQFLCSLPVCSQLWSEILLLTRDIFSQVIFCQNQSIPIIWRNP